MSLGESRHPFVIGVDKLCEEWEPSTLELVAAASALLSRCDLSEGTGVREGRCSKCLVAQAMSGRDTCERCNL